VKPIVRIALIGDYSPEVTAHVAIPRALALAAEVVACDPAPDWIATPELARGAEQRLAPYDAIWCVPASPYASMDGALNAIRFARETGRPFLGTCGGCQHALIEYARGVLGLANADHAESNPDAELQLITPLACALRETRDRIRLLDGTRIYAIYGRDEIMEGYNCSYGLNPAFRALLEASRMHIVGVDDAGDVRVVELEGHPFFVATLFQPERSALTEVAHPLIAAYLRAALSKAEIRD
jgi:CTP synthase (UTP-ammonia lyase)